MLLLSAISTAFAHTHCLSPSVCLLKSFVQASTSLLRGRRGRSRAPHRFSFAVKFGVNAFPCRRYNPSVFSACETSRKSSSPCTGEPRRLPPQSHGIAKEQSAVKPAVGGLPSSVTVQRSAQHRATFPKGKAKAALESQTPQREPRRRASAAVRPPLPRCETQHYNPSVFLRQKGAKIQLPLHRGAKNALSHFCALFRIPN